MIVLSVKHHENELVSLLKEKIGDDVMTAKNVDVVPEMVKSIPYVIWVVDINTPNAIERIIQIRNAAVIATTHKGVTVDTAVSLIGHAKELLRDPSILDVFNAVSKYASVFSYNGYTVDTNARKAWYSGKEMELTPTQFSILAHLVRRSGSPSTYRSIAFDIYNEMMSENEASARLKTHIHNLRKNLIKVSGSDPLTTSQGHVFWLVL